MNANAVITEGKYAEGQIRKHGSQDIWTLTLRVTGGEFDLIFTSLKDLDRVLDDLQHDRMALEVSAVSKDQIALEVGQ